MASILGRIGGATAFVLLAFALLVPVVVYPGPAAAAGISEEDLYAFITVFGEALTSCDMVRYGRMLATDVDLQFTNNQRRTRPTRQEFLAAWENICKAGGRAEQGFKVLQSTTHAGGSTASMQFVISKQYRLGLINRKQMRATMHQDYVVQRSAYGSLHVTRLHERAHYEELGEHPRTVSAEEAVPMPPLMRWQRMLLDPWLTQADRELLDQSNRTN